MRSEVNRCSGDYGKASQAANDVERLAMQGRPPRLFLIGYRATGKTTVARHLAAGLGWSWLDLDKTLETAQGRTILDIFAQDGEAAFRIMEAEALEDVCRLTNHVIATGGGVILREANRRRLREAGQVIWLTADPATLWERLQVDATAGRTRPALTTGGAAEVEQVLQLREPLYRSCAHLMVDTAQRTPQEVSAEILARINSLRPTKTT
jgi:shikimate kinase